MKIQICVALVCMTWGSVGWASAAPQEVLGGTSTWRVGPASDPDCDFQHLQDAIDEAASACTFASPCIVRVSGPESLHLGNTYTVDGNDLQNTGELNIIGGHASCDADSPEPGNRTVLNADGNGRVFDLLYNTTSSLAVRMNLSNLEIRGGVGGSPGGGGGIRIEGHSGRQSVRLSNLLIQNNSTVSTGGGISINATAGRGEFFGPWVTISDDTLISNNEAGTGGGIACVNLGNIGGDSPNRPIELTDVSIVGNEATHIGGGLSVDGCTDVEINTAGTGLLGDGAIFLNTVSDGDGGGIFVRAGGDVTYQAGGAQHAALIQSNQAVNGGGAAVRGSGSRLKLGNARVLGNFAAERGGGIHVTDGAELVMDRISSAPGVPPATCLPGGINPACSHIGGNETLDSHGGALYVEHATARIDQTFIDNNVAGVNGPGLGSVAFVRGADAQLRMEGAAIHGNHGSSRLFQIEDAAVRIFWSTIAGNHDPDHSVQIFRLLGNAGEPFLNIQRSIVWEPDASHTINATGNTFARAFCTIGHFGSESAFDDTSSYSEIDPGLVDADGGDLRLQVDSPAIDYCSPGDAVVQPVYNDMFDQPRGVEYGLPTIPPPNGGNGVFDIGAYERQPPEDQIFHDRFQSEVREFPGAKPCDTTLQACIDDMTAGSVIEVATGTTIEESLVIDKSLTLRPATGFEPMVNGSLSLRSGETAAAISLSGFEIRGSIRVFPSSGDLDVTIADNTIHRPFSTAGQAIGIFTGTANVPRGDLQMRVMRNRLEVEGNDTQCRGIRIGSFHYPGESSIRVEGNHIKVSNCRGGGITVANGVKGHRSEIDLVGNIIEAPGTNNGISVSGSPQGAETRARIINNVITGQQNHAGAPGALVVRASGSLTDVEAEIVNNTIAYNQTGLLVSARTDLGAEVTGLVANNITAFNGGGGLAVDPDLTDVVAEHNLLFPEPPTGPKQVRGTIVADPRFLSEQNFRLVADSPAINAGANAHVPSDIDTDADGLPRIANGNVDIGAFERQ